MSLLELCLKSTAVDVEGNLSHKSRVFVLAAILADIYLCVLNNGDQARIESMVPNSVIVKTYVDYFFFFHLWCSKARKCIIVFPPSKGKHHISFSLPRFV